MDQSSDSVPRSSSPAAQKASPPSPATSGASTPQPPAYSAPKILGRNVNGTLVLTSSPNNEAELQLYRVMQRASLLAYYDTLLEMGGDDVQQLCEAGEEEFLEIMALVGMASKPLHVRRLQKALQEWLTNPGMFQTPLVSPGLPGNFLARNLPPFLSSAPSSLVSSISSPSVTSNVPFPPSSPPPVESTSAPSPGSVHTPIASPGQSPLAGEGSTPLQLTPVLVEAQIAKLAEIAERLVKALPHLEPKAQNSKKKICKDLEAIFQMSDDDPRRMELIRKYSAIYGRFDCKRKPEKPLTLHEVSVNEAAAQMCKYVPALLTRRDELFPLARQVVRDSGYHYSKGHSKSTAPSFLNGDLNLGNNKRLRLSDDLRSHCEDNQDKLHLRQNRLEEIGDELKSIDSRIEELLGSVHTSRDQLRHQMDVLQSRHSSLLLEQKELIKQHNFQVTRQLSRSSMNQHPPNSCFESDRADTDDTDSQVSFGNASSPGASQVIADSHPESVHDSNLERISIKKYGRQIATLEENNRGRVEENDVINFSRSPRHGHSPEISTFNKSPSCRQSNGSPSQVTRFSKSPPHRHSGSSPTDDPTYRPPPYKHSNGSPPLSYNSNIYDSYYHENRVQVISSSGGNIIAVANPALSMSSLLSTTSIKRELHSPVQSTPISSTGINC